MLVIHILFTLMTWLWTHACGTADPKNAGRCLPVSSGTNYVASAEEGWTIDLIPNGGESLSCAREGETGFVNFIGIVKDHQSRPIGGVSVSPMLSGSSSLVIERAERRTDSCGVVFVRIKWICPPDQESVSAKIFLISGALRSEMVELEISRSKEEGADHSVATVPTSGSGGSGGSGDNGGSGGSGGSTP